MTGQKQADETSQELTRAMALHRNGRFAEAGTAYQAILAKDPENADALHLLGLIAYQLGNFGPAAEFIDSALRLRPDEAKFHSNRGNIAKSCGDIEGARRSYERALDCDPGFADARFNLGVLLQESGDLALAADVYRTLLEIAPEYVDAAESHGVDPKRLVFAERRPKARHLRRIQIADLALDTLIYNGHTTTSDTLWAGVPVIALEGKHFASRVSASCLRAVGLPELIAPSPEAFKELAISLARDPAALATLKTRLRENRTHEPLFDTARFARALEDLFSAIWHRHEQGLPPSLLGDSR